MPKRPGKIDPLDIEELFRSPSLEGMLSFRDVDPATAAHQVKAKYDLTPIGAVPTGAAGGGEAATDAPARDSPHHVSPVGVTPPVEIPTGATPLATDHTPSSAEILAEMQDASRAVRSAGRIMRALTVEDGHSGNENALYWHLWKSGRHVRNSESRFVQMGYAVISKAVGLDRTNVQNILRTLEAKLAIRVVTAGTAKSSTVYEVLAGDRILKQRAQAGLLWVQRYGSRRVDFVDENGNRLVQIGTTPADVAPAGTAPPLKTPTGAGPVPA